MENNKRKYSEIPEWKNTVREAISTGNYKLVINEDGSEGLRSLPTEKQKEANAALEVYENCRGFKLKAKFRGLGITAYTFQRNYFQLLKLLEDYEDPQYLIKNKLWDYDQRHKLDQYLQEVCRLLHNFVASSKTLVDHSRIVISGIQEEKGFREEYGTWVETRFTNNGLVQFILNFRNYVLHQTMPFVFASMSSDYEQRGIFLHINILKKNWQGNSVSFKYLNSLPVEVMLKHILKEYYEEISVFNKELEDRIEVVFETEFSELEGYRDKVINLQDKI